MKKLALGALFAGLMACGGGSNNTVTLVDGPTVDGMSVCNPLMQSGCLAGEKCGWIIDQAGTATTASIGHIGCAATGAIAVGGQCMTGAGGMGATGADNCVGNAACVSGECKLICDPNLGAPMCDANHSCSQYQNLFVNSGTTVAGVCDPSCDPLTQELKVGTPSAACGSPDPTKPTKGCYGYDDFSCSNTGVNSNPASLAYLDLTDRTMPRGEFLNSCAPGFLRLWYESETVMVGKCAGYCAVLPIDNTSAHSGNGLGSTAALAKLPKEAAAAAGNGTCGPTKKGSISGGDQMCVHFWTVAADDATGEIPATFEPYITTLGACFSYTQFKYDNDGSAQTPDVVQPNCNTLPPTSPDTMMPWLGAYYFGCQPPMMAFTGKKHELAPSLRDLRPALKEQELRRHELY